MKKTWFVLTFFFLIIFPYKASATSGACSYHNGVNCSIGADIYGYAVCNDGFHSDVLFSQMSECDYDPCDYLNPLSFIKYFPSCNISGAYVEKIGNTALIKPFVDCNNSDLTSFNKCWSSYEDCTREEDLKNQQRLKLQQDLDFIQQQKLDAELVAEQALQKQQAIKDQQTLNEINALVVKAQFCRTVNATINFSTKECDCDVGYSRKNPSFKNNLCTKNEIPKPVIIQPLKATSTKAIIKKPIIKKIIVPAKKKVLKSK